MLVRRGAPGLTESVGEAGVSKTGGRLTNGLLGCRCIG